MMRSESRALCLVATTIVPGALSFKLWDTPGDLPGGIPASCRVALIGEIECQRLVRPNEVQTLGSLTKEFLDENCQPTCVNSLNDFADLVDQRCGWESYEWGGGLTRSGNDVVQPLVWAQNVACLRHRDKDAWCMPALASQDISECDDCLLQYMASFVHVEFAPDIISPAKFEELLESCEADPTEYPAETMTVGDPTGPTQPGEPEDDEDGPRGCFGDEYTVEAGDTCETIAEAHSLAYHRFLAENSLDPRCETLLEGGSVCIGLPCKLQEIQANQTCNDILSDKRFTIVELQAWNPIIYRDCSNLPDLEGYTICVCPPGSDDYDVDISVTLSDPVGEPTGWVPAPTTGQDSGNDTIPTGVPELPTESGAVDESAGSEYDAVVTNCPVTNEVREEGFSWDMFDEECSIMVEPYCKLPPSGAEYPPSTTFPASCLPSNILDLTS